MNVMYWNVVKPPVLFCMFFSCRSPLFRRLAGLLGYHPLSCVFCGDNLTSEEDQYFECDVLDCGETSCETCYNRYGGCPACGASPDDGISEEV